LKGRYARSDLPSPANMATPKTCVLEGFLFAREDAPSRIVPGGQRKQERKAAFRPGQPRHCPEGPTGYLRPDDVIGPRSATRRILDSGSRPTGSGRRKGFTALRHDRACFRGNARKNRSLIDLDVLVQRGSRRQLSTCMNDRGRLATTSTFSATSTTRSDRL